MNSLPHVPGIYKITCLVNGRFYIGSSNDLRVRWHNHKKQLRKGNHYNIHLQRAWDKYGENAFEIEVIELVMPWSLLDREQYWLDTLNPYGQNGFNNNHKATGGSNKGFHHSPETRAKMSLSAMGKKHTPETLEKLRVAKRGKKLTPEHVAKIAEGNKGKTRSPELRARISAKLQGHPGWTRGVKLTPEQKQKIVQANSKDYIITTPDGDEFTIHGLTSFCRENGLSQAHMSAVAAGQRKHHKGWKCRRSEDEA